MNQIAKRALLVSALALGGCAQAGTLGDILGGVMNAPAQTLTGTVQGIDDRANQIFVRTSDNQSVAVTYDDRTSVVYQQQNYPVSALERGDEITLRLTNASNNTYYTDRIEVTRSVSNSGTGSNSNVQSLQGTVRQIDMTNGAFTLSTTNQGLLTVSMPYNPRSADLQRFRNLRSGDYVRLYGTFLTNSRIELQQFY
jgi:hypothetical protein